MSEEALVKEYIKANEFRQDLSIDLTDINGAMQKQASLYAYWAQQAVYARTQLDRFKMAVQRLEAKLDKEYRESLIEDGKKPTEPAIKAAVVNDPRWLSAQTQLLRAHEQHRLAEVAESAFSQRKDTVLQIARNMAKESEGALRVALNGSNRERLANLLRQNNPEQTAS